MDFFGLLLELLCNVEIQNNFQKSFTINKIIFAKDKDNLIQDNKPKDNKVIPDPIDDRKLQE